MEILNSSCKTKIYTWNFQNHLEIEAGFYNWVLMSTFDVYKENVRENDGFNSLTLSVQTEIDENFYSKWEESKSPLIAAVGIPMVPAQRL